MLHGRDGGEERTDVDHVCWAWLTDGPAGGNYLV
jgi:hypothetical protein